MTWQRQIWVIRVEEDIIASHQRASESREKKSIRLSSARQSEKGEAKEKKVYESYFNSIKKIFMKNSCKHEMKNFFH